MSDVTLSRFLGINNRRSRKTLSAGEEGRYLADAVNVDIDETLNVVMRKGVVKEHTLTAGRSLFNAGGRFFYADGATLYAGQIGAAAAIATVNAGNRVVYADVDGTVCYSDSVSLGAVDASDIASNLAVPVPAQPTSSTIAGTLQPASYTFLMTYVVNGIEGGACPMQSHALVATGGIRITLPATPSGVASIGLYVSGPDGTEPRRVGTVAAGTTHVDVTAAPNGRVCNTRNKGPMPAGTILAGQNGRLLSVVDNILYYSEPYNLGLNDKVGGYVPFPKPITIVQPCGNSGVFVVADKTYWIAALGSEEAVAVHGIEYGAVPGTSGSFEEGQKCYWLSERGIIVGDTSGQAANVQIAAQDMRLTGRGSSAYLPGQDRIVATHDL